MADIPALSAEGHSADHTTLTDAKGGKSVVTQGDVIQLNGVIHVVDAVLMPK